MLTSTKALFRSPNTQYGCALEVLRHREVSSVILMDKGAHSKRLRFLSHSHIDNQIADFSEYLLGMSAPGASPHMLQA